MDKNSEEKSNFGDSLQRLKKGLQKTIQIFRVYEGDANRDNDSYNISISSQSAVISQSPRDRYGARTKPQKVKVIKRDYRHYPEREEQIETEISAIELGSDYDASSLGESSSNSEDPCNRPKVCANKSKPFPSATDDTFEMSSISKKSVRRTRPIRFQHDVETGGRRNISKKHPRSILKDDTSDTGSIHSQTSLRVAMDVRRRQGNVEQIDSHTAALEHNIITTNRPKLKRPPSKRSARVADLSSSPESEQESATKRYTIYVRKQQSPKSQSSESFIIDVPPKKVVLPPPTSPPRKQQSFTSDDYYSPSKIQQPPPSYTPFPVKSRTIDEVNFKSRTSSERRPKSLVVEDEMEGPINRFNYALVYADRSNVMRMELRYLLSYLEKNGLEVQCVRGEHQNANMVFVLIHMPIATLVQETQKQKVRLSCMLPYYPTEEPTKLHWVTACFAINQEEPKQSKEEQRVFVTSTEKILFIHQRVDRAKFGPEPEHYGIDEMIKEDIIVASFPLHDGDSHPTWLKKLSDRQNLTAFWGKLARFTHLQPLRLVNKYFGTEIAFYFAWVGYLACFLTPVAVYGCFVFFVGIASLSHPEDTRIEEVCNSEDFMCPLCLNHEHCDFAAIKDSCFYSRLNYIFDNSFMQSFPYFMGIWMLIFVIYWKRVENILKLEWNLYHTNMESFIRSNFLKKIKDQHIEIPYKGEPRIPFLWRVVWRTLSMLIMMTIIGLLCLTVFVLALLRISLTHKLAVRVDRKKDVNVSLISNGMYSSNLICSFLSGILIIIYSKIFPFVVSWVTAMETPRTDREYSVSYTNKLFILECFNNFSNAVYMAFFREFKFWYPGDSSSWTYASGIKRNMCDPSGCIADLSIYIAIVLGVKILYNWIATGIFVYMNVRKRAPIVYSEQWESDYELTDVNYKLYIPTLYMEPVMKYGFLAFSAAFPLAPLMILIDMAVTIRMNALMFCQLLRRPVPRRVVGLEAWEAMIQLVSLCGIIINIYVLCFTTDAMNRAVFFSYNKSFKNYFKDTISDFNIAHYPDKPKSVGISKCYFRGNRIPADNSEKYKFTLRYSEIVMYEHIVTVRFLLGLLAFGLFFYFLIWNHERERPYDETLDD